MKAVALQSTSDGPHARKEPRARIPPVPISSWFVQPISAGAGLMVQRTASCACGGSCPRCQQPSHPKKVQTKLAISMPGDRYEQEADRVADQVMRMPDPIVQRQGQNCSDASISGLSDDHQPEIQRQTNGAGSTPRVTSEFASSRGAGVPLDSASRNFFEPRFGYDFSHVRIHPNNHLAPRLQARAFTVGSDIYFAPGQFLPSIPSGQRLIAHELSHTIQQSGVTEPGATRTNQSSLIPRISPARTSIQREVGESEVASSGQVLTRIGARVSAADAHAAAIVRFLRALNSRIPAASTPPPLAPLRALIINEPLFRAGTADLLRLSELALEFNPGAGRDSPHNAFVYTCRCGWIDMGHFFFSAAAGYIAGFLLRFVTGLRARLGGVNAADASLIIGWFMEHLQEAFRQFVTGPFGGLLNGAPTNVREAVMGNVRSAFTVEDLPSDKFGADIGQEVFDDWLSSAASGAMGMDLAEPEPFDISSRMTSFFSDCKSVFPTGQTRRAMVEETVGTEPLPRQHFSTTPVLLTNALGLCPVPETACPAVDERGWERANQAGRIDEASDRTTLWNFAVDVPDLKAEHQERLRQAVTAAPAGAMIMVEGFASCSGSSTLNERLARSRAQSAAAFLRAQRSDLRVGMNYFGERTPRPPVAAGDGEAMARNRRVEIYIVDVAQTRFGLPAFQLPTRAPLPVTGASSASSAAGSEGK